MVPADIAEGVESSNAFARRRDAILMWLLTRHPVTAQMLVEIGYFQTKARAAKRLRRLVQKGQVRITGTVSLKDGRPEHVYVRGRHAKTDTLLHEVQISRICFKVHADDVRRGSGDVDRFLLPDAELWINGRRYYLEFDRGTMGVQSVVETRFMKYATCADFVLWVCVDASRMEQLRREARMIREAALFTTLDQALGDPHATIWMDFDGNVAALPRAKNL